MIELLRKRRSIRRYQTREIPESIITELKESALRAPTSRNRKEWKFWFITNPEQLEQLSQAKSSGSAMIKNAPLAIVIGADESECDVWVEDCSIAAILLQLNAQDHDIGSVWVQIRKRQTANEQSSEERVKEILRVNDSNIRIASIIALGYPDEQKEPIPANELKWSAIQE